MIIPTRGSVAESLSDNIIRIIPDLSVLIPLSLLPLLLLEPCSPLFGLWADERGGPEARAALLHMGLGGHPPTRWHLTITATSFSNEPFFLSVGAGALILLIVPVTPGE